MNWFNTELKRLPYYRLFQRQYKQALDTGIGVVVERLKAGRDVRNAIAGVDTIAGELKNIMIDTYRVTGEEFRNDTVISLEGTRKGLATEGWERHALFYITQNRFPLITSIEDTLKIRIDRLLRAGVADGLGANDLARLLTDFIPNLTTAQAVRIARTEVINASNMASHYGAHETGLSLDKSWLSTMDGRTREDHVQMDANLVPLDQPFILPDGSKLMWPGDSQYGAPAEQTINCRCSEGFSRD